MFMAAKIIAINPKILDVLKILSEDPDIVTTAPHTTDVKRVDEVWAARNLILKHPGKGQI